MMPLGPQFTEIFHISDSQFGWLVSAYTLSGGVAGLLASIYIERFDRKKLLLALYSLFAVSTLACGVAWSYEALLVARVAAGVFGGVLAALSQTIVGDVIPFERRGRAMGIVMTSFSVSTVAGVPLGLFLAAHWSWQAPFIGIALMCLLFIGFAQFSMPPLTAHLHLQAPSSAVSRIAETLADKNHQRAFVFSGLMMFTGFTVIPYITIYMQTNVGLHTQQIPYIYLCGGVATLLTARLFGRLTDSKGKFQTFRVLASAVLIPLFAVTLLQPGPLWIALLATTLFFVFMSGRIIPGMAMLTSAANPALRGTFMTLNSSVQSAAMGLAALTGGVIIHRDAYGLVEHYWMAALAGGTASLFSIWVARRLKMRQ